MKKNAFRLILSMSVLLLLLVSLAPIDPGEGADVDTRIIDEGESIEWVDEEVILDETLIIRGTLRVTDTELFIKGSDGGQIIVEDEGTLRIENSVVQSYYRRYYSRISLDIDEGYNILSFPFYRDNNSIRNVLEPLEGRYRSAWYYDQQEGYINFRPDRDDHFNDLEVITKEMGVNLDITDASTHEIEGILPKQLEVELQAGFNMVSYPYPEERKVSDVFSGILDRVESVSTVISGEDVHLSENDNMVPGRGYGVEIDNDCVWEIYNEKGLEKKDAFDLGEDKSTRIDYQAGSSGYIRNSRFEFLGDSTDTPGLIIRSDSVSIESTNFERNFNDITIESATSNIYNSRFENSTDTAIRSSDSSFTAVNNEFLYSPGYAIKATRGSPILKDNVIRNNRGVHLEETNARVSSHNIQNTVERGVFIEEGSPLIEENVFIGNPIAVGTSRSNVSIIDNIFDGNNIGIHIHGGKPAVEDNMFEDEGHGIIITQGSGTIKNNEIRNIDGWGIDIRDSKEYTVINNNIRDSTFGMRLSGEDVSVNNNLIAGSLERGVVIRRSRNFVFEDNVIRRCSDIALTVEESQGMVIGNQVSNNYAGVELRTDVSFMENTLSDNTIYGINVRGSSPYLEGNILSNNEEYALRFEDSSSLVKRVSILNSQYHLYLINSKVRVINSPFREDRTYVDHQSVLESKNILNASMDEGTSLVYDLYEYLPPDSEITGVYDKGPVEVDIRPDSIYFNPEDYFSGTVNMTFNITISGEWETEVPFSLEIRPVNNPPRILNKTVEVTYEPTRVRWEVIYEDKDRHLPTSIELVVDGDHYQMNEYNESDQDTFDGKKYYYEMYLEPGEYEYYIKATENNPLGANQTINTQFYDLEISPPKPGLWGLSTQEAASLGTLIFVSAILIFYLRYSRGVPKGDDEKTTLKEDRTSEYSVKTLPILSKKNDASKGSKGSTEDIPVLQKKNGRKDSEKKRPVLKKKEDVRKSEEGYRKHRVVKGEMEEQETDGVGESEERRESEEAGFKEEKDVREDEGKDHEKRLSKEESQDDPGVRKKQRVVRDKKTVRPKNRVLKEDGSEKGRSGKLKRVLKKDKNKDQD